MMHGRRRIDVFQVIKITVELLQTEERVLLAQLNLSSTLKLILAKIFIFQMQDLIGGLDFLGFVSSWVLVLKVTFDTVLLKIFFLTRIT